MKNCNKNLSQLRHDDFLFDKRRVFRNVMKMDLKAFCKKHKVSMRSLRQGSLNKTYKAVFG